MSRVLRPAAASKSPATTELIRHRKMLLLEIKTYPANNPAAKNIKFTNLPMR